MFGTGNSFEPDQVENPTARFGFTYRILGGVKMSFPPLR